MTIPIPADAFTPRDEGALVSSRRQDGWSAASQRLFLEAIAEGHGVNVACLRVGLSAASAYAFRRTAKGAAFALGWRAATLVARDCIAATLLVRALEGQVDSYTRADGTVVTRHRHDNRLAMGLLARLDRQVEVAADADVQAARLVAQEFDAYLDLVARDEGPARAGLFLARRTATRAVDPAAAGPDLGPIYALAAADRLARTGVATAAEVDVRDLDPAARAGWTAEQWCRAEAAGLLALAAPDAEDPPASQHCQHWEEETDPPVWWDEQRDEWRTRFPPPDGFDGHWTEQPGHVDYDRTLSAEEAALVGCPPHQYDAAEMTAQRGERDAWFAALAAETEARPDAALSGSAAVEPPLPAPADATDKPARGTIDVGRAIPACQGEVMPHVAEDATPDRGQVAVRPIPASSAGHRRLSEEGRFLPERRSALPGLPIASGAGEPAATPPPAGTPRRRSP